MFITPLILCLLFFSFVACSNNNEAKHTGSEVNNNTADSNKSAATQSASTKDYTKVRKLKVLHPEQYNAEFLETLKGMDKEMTMENDYIVMGSDTLYIPTDLILNKAYKFKGTASNGDKYELDVKRTNFTNVDYNYTVHSKDGQLQINMSGEALMNAEALFTDSEIDEDDESSYATNLYTDIFPKQTIVLRIGAELDSNGKQRAKVSMESSSMDLEDNCPMLKN